MIALHAVVPLAVYPPVSSGVALNFAGVVIVLVILGFVARWVASRPRRPRGRVTTQAHAWLRTTDALHPGRDGRNDEREQQHRGGGSTAR